MINFGVPKENQSQNFFTCIEDIHVTIFNHTLIDYLVMKYIYSFELISFDV
jgi:hypothetical protein